MWFAALGSYQHNPWLLHLCYKLLHGSTTAISLLDVEQYPFHERPPTHVRASLYHYDFTRLRSPWAEAIGPGATIINATRGSSEHKQWWARQRVSEYIPTVDVSMLQSVAKQQGWIGKDDVMADPCKKHGGALCQAVVSLRKAGGGIRRFVGWTGVLPEGVMALLWAGTAAEVFIDGPMLLIIVTSAVPLTMPWLLSMLRRPYDSQNQECSTTPKIKSE
jgi:hypothetical protein